MFITKKHLSRRTFLRGAGVAVGLPLLDAMVPAWTALAQTAASPKPRMGFMYLPHGAIMEQWTPAAEGTSFELTPILKPFAPFQKQLTIVSGLENKGAIAPPVHALSPGTWLSCVTPRRGAGTARRRHRRSDRGRAPRPGHAAAVARSRDRRPRRQWRRVRPHATAAATARRSRSGRRRRRCRWKPIRASCSSGSSVRATRRRSGRRSRSSTRAFSIWSPQEAADLRKTPRRPGPGAARRLSGERSRDRAARPEDGRAGPDAAWICPTCRSAARSISA